MTDQGVRRTEDKDFGKAFAWDVDLLSGYPHRFLALRGPWNLRTFNGLPLAQPVGQSLREAGATALWVEGWRFKPFWEAVSEAKKMGIPIFLRGETTDKITERGGLFGLVRRFALHRLFAKVDHFLAIGQASKRFYLKHGVPWRKLIDAPYGVDNEFFRTEVGKLCGSWQGARGEMGAHFDNLTEGQRAIREKWNIPLDAKVVMFCGKFVRKKRPMDVVLAARAHFERGKVGDATGEERLPEKWHLLFVGSGELGSELRAVCDVRFDAEAQNHKIPRTQNLGAPPASFAGFLNQSEIAKAYAAADVMVLPSEAWETWGLVVNEATAAGVPTVVSEQCGCAEDFAAKNPFTRVFPTGNVRALAAACNELLSLAVERREVSLAADTFDPQITAKSVRAVLMRA